MPLPKLNWRVVSPSRPATTAATDVIATLKTQIQTLQYWQLVESPNTGSTSLLIKPVSTYSSSSNMNVVITTGITGSPAYRSPDTNASNGQYRLQVGLTPDITDTFGGGGSGSFRGPNADRPFQSDTGNPRWSGYWHCANTGSISASFLLESEDSIFIGFKDISASSGTQGVLVGNIIETLESASGENDRRLYGMATGGPVNFSTIFWTSKTDFLGTSSTANTAHAGVFVVSNSNAQSDTQWAYCFPSVMSTLAYNDFSTWGSATPVGSRQVGVPVSIYTATATNTAPFRYLGVMRGVYMGSDEASIAKIQSGGIDQVYKVGTTMNNTITDALLFGPASGSGL